MVYSVSSNETTGEVQRPLPSVRRGQKSASVAETTETRSAKRWFSAFRVTVPSVSVIDGAAVALTEMKNDAQSIPASPAMPSDSSN